MSTQQQYFLAAQGPNGCDNGFGFGQGSTDGVINTYGHRGFARPQLGEYATALRDNFNMRACMGAYACHFDPAGNCEDEDEEKPETRPLPIYIERKQCTPHILKLLFIALFIYFVWRLARQ